MEQVYLKIVADIKCEVYIDEEMVNVAEKDLMLKIPLKKGEYFLQLISIRNRNVKIEDIVCLEFDKVVKVNFEEFIQMHIELLNDDEVFYDSERKAFVNVLTEKIITPSKYDEGSDFNKHLAIVRCKGKYGCIDKSGKEIVPLQYDKILNCGEDGCRILYNGLWGLLDYQGCEILPCSYLDENFKVKLCGPLKYDDVGIMTKYKTRKVKVREKYGIVDYDGNEIIPCVYEDIIQVDTDLFGIRENSLWRLINIKMKVISSSSYDDIKPCIKGLIAVKKKYAWGCINRYGDIIIPYEYMDISNLSDQLIEVSDGRKWGIYNREGKLITQCVYKLKEQNSSSYYCDRYDDGSCINEFDFREWINGMYPVCRDEKWGFINSKGIEKVPCIYDSLLLVMR